MHMEHFVERSAGGDEMGEDEVGLVEVVTVEVGMDFDEVGAGAMAMKEREGIRYFNCRIACVAHGREGEKKNIKKNFTRGTIITLKKVRSKFRQQQVNLVVEPLITTFFAKIEPSFAKTLKMYLALQLRYKSGPIL